MRNRHCFLLAWKIAFGAALGAIVTGLWLGEARQVLLNAVSICLACLGVG